MILSELRDDKDAKNNKYIIEDEQADTIYGFDCYGLLVSVSDKKGNVTLISYDENKRIKKIETPSGKTYSFTLNDEGNASEISIPSGHKLRYEYEDGCLTSFTNADGDKVTYEYDDKALMTSWHDGNNNRQVLNTYDKYGRVVKQVDAAGGVSTITYDRNSTEIEDAEGNDRTCLLYTSRCV